MIMSFCNFVQQKNCSFQLNTQSLKQSQKPLLIIKPFKMLITLKWATIFKIEMKSLSDYQILFHYHLPSLRVAKLIKPTLSNNYFHSQQRQSFIRIHLFLFHFNLISTFICLVHEVSPLNVRLHQVLPAKSSECWWANYHQVEVKIIQ